MTTKESFQIYFIGDCPQFFQIYLIGDSPQFILHYHYKKCCQLSDWTLLFPIVISIL